MFYIRGITQAEFISALSCRDVRCGAEIGVWKGDFSCELLKALPDLTLYLIDPWRNVTGNTDKATDISNGAYEKMYRMVKELVREYPNVRILRKCSLEALQDVPDGTLDFVYIDADHKYEAVKADIEGWSKKVKVGGIVSGHDFDFGHPGVIRAIEELHPKDLYVTEFDHIWYFLRQ